MARRGGFRIELAAVSAPAPAPPLLPPRPVTVGGISATALVPFQPVLNTIQDQPAGKRAEGARVPVAFSFTIQPRSIGASGGQPYQQLQMLQNQCSCRIGAAPLIAGRARVQPSPPSKSIECEDQYTVSNLEEKTGIHRITQLMYTVMCLGCCQPQPSIRNFPTSIMGEWGHFERLSAWTHLVAAAAFFAYGISCAVRFDTTRSAEAWATTAAFVTAGTFLTSTVYHCVGPDPTLSAVLKEIDFIWVYLQISVSSVADLAAVTRGFENVQVASIVDAPLASLILAGFFLYRRSWASVEETQVEEYGSCSIGAMFRRSHSDQSHSVLRQVGSLAISLIYYTASAAILSNLPDGRGVLVLAMQAAAFVLVLLGMVLDKYILWPDWYIATNGSQVPCTSSKSCGCVLNHHAIWHVMAFLATVLLAAAREIAVAA